MQTVALFILLLILDNGKAASQSLEPDEQAAISVEQPVPCYSGRPRNIELLRLAWMQLHINLLKLINLLISCYPVIFFVSHAIVLHGPVFSLPYMAFPTFRI